MDVIYIPHRSRSLIVSTATVHKLEMCVYYINHVNCRLHIYHPSVGLCKSVMDASLVARGTESFDYTYSHNHKHNTHMCSC